MFKNNKSGKSKILTSALAVCLIFFLAFCLINLTSCDYQITGTVYKKESTEDTSGESIEDTEMPFEEVTFLGYDSSEQYYSELSELIKKYDKKDSVGAASAGSKRLIVMGEPDFEGFSPAAVLKDPLGMYIIQFNTAEEAASFKNVQLLNQAVDFIDEDGFIANSKGRSSLQSIGSWGTEYIDAAQFSSYVKNNSGNNQLIVAVVDTGVDYSHNYLVSRVVSTGRDFVDNDNKAMDENGHGTHVAGTIVDCTPDLNVKILPVRVLDEFGFGSNSEVIAGIYYAIENGAKVINLSLGGYGASDSLNYAVRFAIDHGAVVCIAAGNSEDDTGNYTPANIMYPGAVVVSAIDREGNIAFFSNYGDSVDVAAPGVSILSCYMNNTYISLDGTSMACPHAAASVAMLRMLYPNATPAEIESYLKELTEDAGEPGVDDYYGSGIIKLSNAIENVPDDVSSIEISSLPRVTEYTVGETLDTTGLEIRVNMESGSSEIISSGFTCTPTTLNRIGSEVINVIYGDKTCTFNVTVNEDVLTSIEIYSGPYRTDYYIGDTFDPSGIRLLAFYATGKSSVIDSGFETFANLSQEGNSWVEINYGDCQTGLYVNVYSPTISGLPSSYELAIGCEKTFYPSTEPENLQVSWTTSDSSSVQVTRYGTVKSVKIASSAKITASFSYNGRTYSKQFTVSVPTPTVAVTNIQRDYDYYHIRKDYLVLDDVLCWKITPQRPAYNPLISSFGNTGDSSIDSDGFSTEWKSAGYNGNIISMNSDGSMYVTQPGSYDAEYVIKYNGYVIRTYTVTTKIKLVMTAYSGGNYIRESHFKSSKQLGFLPAGVDDLEVQQYWVDGVPGESEVSVWGLITYKGVTGWVKIFHWI